MPVSLSPSIDMNNVSVRWKHPYVSESLNRKFAGIIPRGVYRGLQLGTNGSALTVSIIPDSVYGDHLAVAEDADGFSLTFRDQDSGTISMSLAGSTSQTVVVALVANYDIGSDTTAGYYSYTLAEYNALSADALFGLVVLGTVVVPASGTISAGSITSDRRTIPSGNAAFGTLSRQQVLKNSTFEQGASGDGGVGKVYAIPYWENSSLAAGSFSLSSTTPDSGVVSLLLTCNTINTDIGSSIVQPLRIPVTAGQGITLSCKVRAALIASTGTLVLRATYKNAADGATTTQDVAISLAGVDASYRTISSAQTVPAGYSHLESVGIYCTALQFGTAVAAVRLDQIRAYIDPVVSSSDNPDTGAALRHLLTKALTVVDGSATSDAAATDAVIANVADLVTGRMLEIMGRDATTPIHLGIKGLLRNIGSSYLGSEAHALYPRVTTPYALGATEYTLLWESPRIDGLRGANRVYAVTDGGITFTTNARWDGTTWNKDVTGRGAYEVIFNHSVVRYSSMAPSLNTAWTTWDNVPMEIGAGDSTLQEGFNRIKGISIFSPDNGPAAGDTDPTIIVSSDIAKLKKNMVQFNGHGVGHIVNPLGLVQMIGSNYLEDFYSLDTTNLYTVTVFGAGSAVSVSYTDTLLRNHLKLSTNAVSAAYAVLTPKPNMEAWNPSHTISAQWKMRFSHANLGTNQVEQFGFTGTGPSGDGSFKFVRNGTGNFFAHWLGDSVDTGFKPTADVDYWFTVTNDPNSRYWITNSPQFSSASVYHTGTLGDGESMGDDFACGPYFNVSNALSATAHAMYCDYFQIWSYTRHDTED